MAIFQNQDIKRIDKLHLNIYLTLYGCLALNGHLPNPFEVNQGVYHLPNHVQWSLAK